MGKPQLLCEIASHVKADEKSILESREKHDGKLILHGLIARADTVNQNQRSYPFDYLKREDVRYQDKIKASRAFGELDHPDEAQVQLKFVSHRVLETNWEGKEIYGSILILDKLSAPSGNGGTPYGETLAGLIESGCEVGISSRSVGTTHQSNEGYAVVNEDLMLIAYDIVSDPSTHNAIMKLKEGLDPEFDPSLYPAFRAGRIDQIIQEILTLKN